MGASLHPWHQKEVHGLERTIAEKIQNCFFYKMMRTVFWDAKVVIWQEYLLKGTTINVERYCETLKNLRKPIKRSGLLIGI